MGTGKAISLKGIPKHSNAPRFRPVHESEVRFAFVSMVKPGFLKKTKKQYGRRAAGLRYETRVQDLLCEISDLYVPSPWLRYGIKGEGRARWCQPDGFLLDLRKGQITLIEVKYKHTIDSWWQLRKLYEPVLKKIFPPSHFQYACIEIVSWYESNIKFPETFYFASDPLEAEVNKFGVHVLAHSKKFSKATSERLRNVHSNGSRGRGS
jgi:hypothetical protein